MSKGDGLKQNSLWSLRGALLKTPTSVVCFGDGSKSCNGGLLQCNKWMVVVVVCNLHMGKLVKGPLLQMNKGLDCSEVQRDLDPLSFILFHS